MYIGYTEGEKMKLADTQITQLAKAIAHMFEEGEEFFVFETAKIEFKEDKALPVIERRIFQIGVKEVTKQ